MKNKLTLLLLFLLSFSMVFATPEVTISSVSATDTTLNQGDSAGLSFIITNTGDRDLDSVKILLTSSLTLSRNTLIFSDFEVGESRVVTATYSVASNLPSGDYAISISADYNIGDSSYSNQEGVIIKVLESNYLMVSSYTTNLVVDETTKFSINVTNHGDSELNDLMLDLILPDGFIPTTGSQFFLDTLTVGESKIFTTNVFVERSIEPDSFQFSLIKTADGYNDSDNLNVVVTGVPEIMFSGINLDPEIPVSGQEQTISVQFENIGSGKAYSVVASIITEEEVTGITTEYLGSLDRDDLTSAIFDVINPVNDDLDGVIQITYTDSEGVNQVVIQSFDFEMVQPTQDNTITYYLIGGAVLVVGYLIYKRFKKK